jgi:two-component system, chemotaxis family, protein-glutamate methylesterase/glutaminase
VENIARSLPPDHSGAARTLRIAIVDESLIVRKLLERMVRQAGHGVWSIAADLSDLHIEPLGPEPDVIIISGASAPDAVQSKLLSRSPQIDPSKIVILTGDHLATTIWHHHDLGRRVGDIVPKPASGLFSRDYTANLIAKIERAAGVPPVPAVISRAERSHWSLRPLGTVPGAIAIGGSTGGVGAIGAIVAALPANLAIPVFITQHLPANFQSLFVQQLARIAQIPVVLAEDGMTVHPGVVHLAPGLAHLGLRIDDGGRVCIQYLTEQAEHKSYPAVDPMLTAAAAVYRSRLCGVILSGMGRDGLIGAQSVVDAGGWLLVQDEPSSTVWGMPGAVVRAGLASGIAPPEEIVAMLIGTGLPR